MNQRQAHLAIDLGGVLLTDGTKTAFLALEDCFGIDARRSAHAWYSYWRIPIEIGAMPESVLWERLAAFAPSPVATNAIREAFLGEFRPIVYGIEFLRDAHDAGATVVLATNHVASWIHRWQEQFDWFQMVGPIFCSSTMGCRKPQADFYRDVRVGVGSEECYFIDDNPENVEAATTAGFNGILAEGDWSTRIPLAR